MINVVIQNQKHYISPNQPWKVWLQIDQSHEKGFESVYFKCCQIYFVTSMIKYGIELMQWSLMIFV